MSRETSCCFTGHRAISRAEYAELAARIDSAVEQLIKRGYTDYYAGGALGFDTLAALRIISLRKKYPFLRLHLILPCRDQTAGWNDESNDIYNSIIFASDSVEYIRDTYGRGCMQQRNRALVDASSVCICYLARRRNGGTAGTVKYAKRCNLKIINLGSLSPDDRQQRLDI